MNYHEAWANGEIEAGTLVDAIEELTAELADIKANRDALLLVHRVGRSLDQHRIETAADNCEVLRARLAKYEDAEGRPLQLSFPAEFLEHVKHARKELCRKETAPFHVRQRLAQKLTDCIAALKSQQGGVVLPERKTWNQVTGREGFIETETHNACLDEVASLNSSPVTDNGAPE